MRDIEKRHISNLKTYVSLLIVINLIKCFIIHYKH